MSTITAVTITPNTIVKGQKAQAVLTAANPDRVSTVHGVDETGASVTATYDVHENLSVLLGQSNIVGGKAPAGTVVVYSDSTTDVLTVDATNPLAVNIQT